MTPFYRKKWRHLTTDLSVYSLVRCVHCCRHCTSIPCNADDFLQKPPGGTPALSSTVGCKYSSSAIPGMMGSWHTWIRLKFIHSALIERLCNVLNCLIFNNISSHKITTICDDYYMCSESYCPPRLEKWDCFETWANKGRRSLVTIATINF